MPTLTVALGSRSYPILIAPGAIEALGAQVAAQVACRRLLVIADATVAAHHLPRVQDALARAGIAAVLETIPPGEGSKTLAEAERLWARCAHHRIDRSDAILALGGGVVGDLAGFVAACWMRGVPCVQVPTTLLAMVDSAVGGKTGVNTSFGKNLVGAFLQPSLVVIDPELLATLPPRAFRAGLAEVLKYGVIRDAAFFAWQEAHAEALVRAEPAAVAHAVATSCAIKASYVAEDEHEHGARAELNYGHTFGHALERETGYATYLHGEAVAIGMRMAAVLAGALGVLEEPQLPARQDALLACYQLPRAHPVPDPAAAAARLAAACALDKKVAQGRTRFILPQRLGAVRLQEAPLDLVTAAFASALVPA